VRLFTCMVILEVAPSQIRWVSHVLVDDYVS
jgi:hypothetical protein